MSIPYLSVKNNAIRISKNSHILTLQKNLNQFVKITTKLQPDHNHFPLPFLIEFSYIYL
jgi:hypothetical protein